MSNNKINKVVFLKYLVICLGLSCIYLRFYALRTEIEIKSPFPIIVIIFSSPIYSVIFAPIIEEVIFRKLLLKLLSFLGQWAAVIISAILFGLGHFTSIHQIYAFVLGVILAIVARKYGTIKYGIAIHIIVNLVGQTSAFINVYVFDAICIIVSVLSIIIILKDYKALFNLKTI